MYILNPSIINKDKLYSCNGIVAEWLIYEKKFPLFARGEQGEFLFVKTKDLEKIISEIPFHLKLSFLLW